MRVAASRKSDCSTRPGCTEAFFIKHVGDLSLDHNHRVRHAIEIRHDSFKDPDFIRLLRKHRVALVISDAATK